MSYFLYELVINKIGKYFRVIRVTKKFIFYEIN